MLQLRAVLQRTAVRHRELAESLADGELGSVTNPTARVLVALLGIFGMATIAVLLDLGSWVLIAVLVLGGVLGYLIAPPRER